MLTISIDFTTVIVAFFQDPVSCRAGVVNVTPDLRQKIAFRQSDPPDKSMLGLAVQPPARSKPGAVLYPPIVARLSSDTNIYEELSQIWAVASLISPDGELLQQQLGGRVADSAHPMADGNGDGAERDRAYFFFPDLAISEPGRYRVRVTLMRMSYSSPDGDVRVDEYVDSHTILVEEEVYNASRPSECCQLQSGFLG
jgi:hypothetical protein